MPLRLLRERDHDLMILHASQYVVDRGTPRLRRLRGGAILLQAGTRGTMDFPPQREGWRQETEPTMYLWVWRREGNMSLSQDTIDTSGRQHTE